MATYHKVFTVDTGRPFSRRSVHQWPNTPRDDRKASSFRSDSDPDSDHASVAFSG
jgi:hypothetical protein